LHVLVSQTSHELILTRAETINRRAGQAAADLADRCFDNQFGEIAVVNNVDTAIEPG
jgi:hypothetical protein